MSPRGFQYLVINYLVILCSDVFVFVSWYKLTFYLDHQQRHRRGIKMTFLIDKMVMRMFTFIRYETPFWDKELVGHVCWSFNSVTVADLWLWSCRHLHTTFIQIRLSVVKMIYFYSLLDGAHLKRILVCGSSILITTCSFFFFFFNSISLLLKPSQCNTLKYHLEIYFYSFNFVSTLFLP